MILKTSQKLSRNFLNLDRLHIAKTRENKDFVFGNADEGLRYSVATRGFERSETLAGLVRHASIEPMSNSEFFCRKLSKMKLQLDKEPCDKETEVLIQDQDPKDGLMDIGFELKIIKY